MKKTTRSLLNALKTSRQYSANPAVLKADKAADAAELAAGSDMADPEARGRQEEHRL